MFRRMTGDFPGKSHSASLLSDEAPAFPFFSQGSVKCEEKKGERSVLCQESGKMLHRLPAGPVIPLPTWDG